MGLLDKEVNVKRGGGSAAQRVARLAVLTALSLIVFRVEAMFPPLFVPGAKIGLSNIFSLIALISLGYWQALALVLARTFLGCLFAGGFSALVYSMTAGVVSITLSYFLLRLFAEKVSITAISVTSAVMHNLVQILIFCLLSSTPEAFIYMPYLVVIGVLAGAVTGATVTLAVNSKPIKNVLGLR